MTQLAVESEDVPATGATPGEPGTATMAPPAPPSAPPSTATAAPKPPRRGGCIIAALVALVVVLVIVGLAFVGITLWSRAHSAPSAPTQESLGAFASAMKKVGVTAPAQPAAPVDLAAVRATGSHPFDATFTPEELSALLDSFSHQVTVANTQISISNPELALENGVLTLSGNVTAGGTSYAGTASGEVTFQNGEVSAPAPLSVQAEGITLGADQSQQATTLLLAYVNGYLAAAPGLKIQSAEVTPTGVHATGTAPDSIQW